METPIFCVPPHLLQAYVARQVGKIDPHIQAVTPVEESKIEEFDLVIHPCTNTSNLQLVYQTVSDSLKKHLPNVAAFRVQFGDEPIVGCSLGETLHVITYSAYTAA